VRDLLEKVGSAPPRQRRIARAAMFTWDGHARIVAQAYRRLLL
jgi:hypothetical protein